MDNLTFSLIVMFLHFNTMDIHYKIISTELKFTRTKCSPSAWKECEVNFWIMQQSPKDCTA